MMGKLKFAIGTLILAGGLATAVVEVRANRSLRAEERALARGDTTRLDNEHQRLSAAAAKLAERNPEIDELTALRSRIATLRARPDGVIDAEIRPAKNLGRATPAEAIETFCWAIDHGDLDLAASFLTFTDATPENREAFMANFSAAVRARYGTVERLCAAAFFGAIQGKAAGIADPAVGVQVVSVEADHGPEQVKIKLWWRTAAGREIGGGETYRLRPDGWAPKPFSLLKPEVLQVVRARIDPLTGDFLPPKAAATASPRP
jgi:hypothetical protein